MSVGSIIGGGFNLVRTQPQVIAIWTVVYAIGAMLSNFAMRPFMAAMVAAQQQAAANAAMGIRTPPAFAGAAFGNLFVLELVFAVLIVIAFAAVVRAVARTGDDSFAYLRLGMDELRLIGLGILLVILAIVAEFVAILVLGLLAGLSAMIIGKGGAFAVGGIVGIALLCAGIYIEVRMSLARALTVLEGRIVIRDAWRATKGQFWTLFGAYFLMSLAYTVAAVIIIAIASPHLLTAYASLNPQAMQAAAQEQYAAQASGFSLGLILRSILGACVLVPMGAVFLGAIATAAIDLTGVRSHIAAEFS